eukprot:TRINITY_DN34092_c0_g1_i1.p1 TRINITY_DN34092_c0_g1~~TRINITY_DN34092_c0_g1_i1.p1  ORF type:complete len:711 (-),score=64.21 TRINITY_DN34092_c0_g1_i1:83-2215(-)
MALDCIRLWQPSVNFCHSLPQNTSTFSCVSYGRLDDTTVTLHGSQTLTGILGIVQVGHYTFYVVSLILALLCLVGLLAWSIWCISQLNGCGPKILRRPRLALKGLWRFVTSARWLLTPESYYSDVEETLRAQMILMAQHQRVENFLRGSKGVAYVFPAVFVWSMVQFPRFLRTTTACTTLECQVEALHHQQTMTALILGPAVVWSLCLIAAMCPHRVGAWFVRTTHCAVFLGIAYHLWDLQYPIEYLTLHQGFLVQVRLAAALFCDNFATTLLLNIAMYFSQVVWVNLRVEGHNFFVAGTVERESLLIMFVIIAVAYVFEHSLLTQVRLVAMTQASSREAGTAKCILNQMCDAVVELRGEQLRVKRPCPKLATLTFRDHVTGFLQGTSFLDLVSEPDRPRLLAELQKSLESTLMMHLHLLDCQGVRIAVQIFVACLPAWNGLLEYVVGVREDNERGERSSGLGPIVPVGRLRRQQIARLAEELRGFPSSREESRESSASDSWEVVRTDTEAEASDDVTTTSLSLLRPPLEGYADASLVWVERTSSMTIVGCSRTFMNGFGPSFGAVGIDFTAWISEDQREPFLAWIRTLGGDAGVSSPSNTPNFKKLKLYPPHLSPSLKVTCSITFITLGSIFATVLEDLPRMQPALVLKLDDMTYKWSKSQTRAPSLDDGLVSSEFQAHADEALVAAGLMFDEASEEASNVEETRPDVD